MKSRTVKILAIFIALAMIVSPVSAAIPRTQAETNGSLPINGDLTPTGFTPTDKYKAEEASDVSVEEVSKDGKMRYIVLFEGDSLVKMNGGAQGLNTKSIESQNYLATLASKRNAILAQAEKTISRSIEVRYVYDVILNGVSVELTSAEAEALSKVQGVKRVIKDTTHKVDTDAGPAWLGAPEIWDGSAVPDEIGTKGEGILVGIIDTGINFDHPSFSDTPADGYVYEWDGDYLGVCAPDGDPAYANACNDKVVGAYSYTKDNPSDFVTPEDSDGHGSHTASTVAGNTVTMEFYGNDVTISGMAPHAQIIAYDVCFPAESGGCYGEGSIAAAQQAIEDGVDVINYSISGGEDPYNDPVELAFLEATDAGVVVSTSAGNDGPAAETVAHRSPWVLSTAASSHNRKFTSIVDFSNPLYQGIATLAGEIPFTEDLTDKAVIYSGEDSGNDLGCEAFPTNFFAGSIALIKRGTCTFTEKILNAEEAGAIGVLIFTSTSAPGPMSVSGTQIPAVMLDIPGTLGDEIAAWVASSTDETVSISAYGRYVDDAFGDIMANFSSRGPNTTFDVLKPDVSAPGLEILAAVADGTISPDDEAEYDLYQGTSMSSPHDAGAAALLKALHPDWTPAEIKSALMLTGYDGLVKEDKTTPTDPFDIGAGRIQLELAGLTGLVMDETIENYEAANPDEGGDPRSLNLPSLYHSQCVGECSWTRTFTSVADLPATYTVDAPEWITVEPDTFTIPAGGTQTITFTADVVDMSTDEWQFARIEFNTESTHPDGDPVTLLQQDFTDTTFPPTGWSVYNVDDGGSTWVRNTARYLSSPASARHVYSCAGEQEGWFVTPQIAIPATGFTFLSFFESGDYTGDMEYHGILVSTGSGVPSDGDFVELAALSAPPEDAWTATPTLVDLSTFAGQDAYVAFKYTGNCTDSWWIDDVQVYNLAAGGAPISDVAIPVAVMPSTGNLPDLTKFVSHRDADSGTLEDLLAVEITELTVDTYGFVKGDLNQIQLAQDPTNGSPYDNLSQVWYTVVPMDAGAARLVAEITATTAVDLDLFWGFDINGDGLPSADEEYQNSATATAYEYLSEWGFPVEFWDVWILVQNWQGSGAALDDITLSIGKVPYEPADPATMTVLGPETNPAGEPFTLDILWHDIDTEAGDRLYGLIDVYADADYETSIGLTQLDVRRGVDDVVKTADVDKATISDVITYTIEITNFATGPTEYAINDVLPEGVTYVPDSATGGAIYDPATNAITWTGTIEPAHYAYDWTTSADDPACTLEVMPDDNPDAYLDWNTTSYGFSTSPSIYGDSFWYSTFSTYPAFNYYGIDYTGMHFTDDGYAGFAFNQVDFVNQEIPDPDDPNNVLAAFWDDLVVQYDAATNKGVTLVGDGASFATIEYDDVYRYGGNPAVTMDVEIGYFLQPDDAPGMYEIIFAFDNIHPDFLSSASATIGVENADGTVGTLVSYNDPDLAIENGSAICFDYVLVPPTHTITFQAFVNYDVSSRELVNEVVHDTGSDFTVDETASASVTIVNLPPVAKDDYYETNQDITLIVPAPGVLENDFDPDPTDEIRADLKTAPLHGSLILNEDGSFIYIPEASFFGTDSFVYYMIAIPSGPAPLSQFVDEALVTIVVKPAFTVYLPLLLK